MKQLIGIAGLLLVACSWIPQLREVMKGKSMPATTFLFVYIFGCGLLTIYAFMLKDVVFILLNAATFILALLNLLLSKKAKRKIKRK